jgi:hypothetical protein
MMYPRSAPHNVAALSTSVSSTGCSSNADRLFYDFEPLFGLGLSPRVIRRVSYFKPRLGSLDVLEP